MEEKAWKDFTVRHLARHPSAQAQDVFKLLHQACYGPGHIIADEGSARRYLEGEWAAAEPSEGMLLEPCDPDEDVVRVHIAVAKARGIPVEAVGEAFLTSARVFKPREDFRELWHFMRELAPSDDEKLDELASRDPPPPVHHSRAFSEAEKPHYRVAIANIARKVIGDDSDD